MVSPGRIEEEQGVTGGSRVDDDELLARADDDAGERLEYCQLLIAGGLQFLLKERKLVG
jgi:hypothetical protein